MRRQFPPRTVVPVAYPSVVSVEVRHHHHHKVVLEPLSRTSGGVRPCDDGGGVGVDLVEAHHPDKQPSHKSLASAVVAVR